MPDERIDKTIDALEDSSNPSTQSDFLNLAIRENAIDAIHSYSIAEANWLEGTQIYGLPTQDLMPKEMEYLSRIVAGLRLLEWRLIWLRNRVLARILTGRELSDEDYKQDRHDTGGSIFLMDEDNEKYWLLQEAAEEGRVDEEEHRRLSRPVIALVTPETYLGAVDSPLVLPPEDLMRLFGDNASTNDLVSQLGDEEWLRRFNKMVEEQESAHPHEPTAFEKRLGKTMKAMDKRSSPTY